MSRSSKKGPWVEDRLLARIQAMNTANTKQMVKTWSRTSTIFPDMVGHTGVIPAVVRACEVADAALATILAAVGDVGGTAIVTADHGNAEQMLESDGSPHTAHTTNLVPLLVTRTDVTLREHGRLADVAPTVLALLGLPQPPEMSGITLLGFSRVHGA